MSNNNQNDHWLVRPSSIRWMWVVFIAVLALTVLAQLVFPIKGYFEVDSWLGFGAVYGFLACLIMVLVAKLLGFVLKRDQDYYQDLKNQTVEDKSDD